MALAAGLGEEEGGMALVYRKPRTGISASVATAPALRLGAGLAGAGVGSVKG